MRVLIPRDRWLSSSLNTDWSSMFDNFDRLFADLRGSLGQEDRHRGGFEPACDIQETDEHFLLSFDLPGVRPEDIKVEVTERQLMVSGERHRQVSEQSPAFARRERAYGRFERSFSLPLHVDSERIEAHYADGVLSLALPKEEKTRPVNIQVQTGKPGWIQRVLGKTLNKEKAVGSEAAKNTEDVAH